MGHFFHIPCAWYLLTMQEAAGHKCWPPSFDRGKFLAVKDWVWKPAKHAAAPIAVSKHMPVSGRSFYLLAHRAGFVNAGNYWSPEYTVLVNVLFIICGLFPEVVKMHSYKIGQYICLSEADGSGSKNAAQNGSAGLSFPEVWNGCHSHEALESQCIWQTPFRDTLAFTLASTYYRRHLLQAKEPSCSKSVCRS